MEKRDGEKNQEGSIQIPCHVGFIDRACGIMFSHEPGVKDSARLLRCDNLKDCLEVIGREGVSDRMGQVAYGKVSALGGVEV